MRVGKGFRFRGRVYGAGDTFDLTTVRPEERAAYQRMFGTEPGSARKRKGGQRPKRAVPVSVVDDAGDDTGDEAPTFGSTNTGS